ncbi:hypothetical protein G6553_01515 [Nocardioides sp. IC4_145]|uniref:hypothetical protein n=1 Tax=Nocardioides sp. IC4_145 TaxID=2714037 RepID=UPI0014088551|nr:hypothetical protein [Nocardioides sp. IC4_145]NHC21852.1 hypothetical protein [Nocardioides sp. IC4_145]
MPYDSRGPAVPRLFQEVLNQEFPLARKDGTRHASDIQDRARRPVRARVVFERDGEAYLDGLAQRWTRPHAFIVIPDPRLQIGAVWLRLEDVVPR